MSAILPERRFDVVNLGALARPNAIEQWTYEGILAARIAKFVAFWNEMRTSDPTLPAFDADALETDPAVILQQVDAFRESLVRQDINERVLATFLLFAGGADLDARAGEYNTVRAAGESDDALRLRALLAWENLSIGGSYGGYEYQARSVAPADILDCAIYGHEIDAVPKGEVRIVLLGRGFRGALPGLVLTRVRDTLTRRDIRKVNDKVVVAQAEVVPYAVDATLIVPRGVDGQVVRDAKFADVQKYAAQRRRIGAAVTFHGLMNALGDDDPNIVFEVEMRRPFAGPVDPSSPPRIGGGAFEVPTLTSLSLDWRTT